MISLYFSYWLTEDTLSSCILQTLNAELDFHLSKIHCPYCSLPKMMGYCTECQRADGHGSEPCPSMHTNTHASLLCVLLWYESCVGEAGLEIEVTVEKGSGDLLLSPSQTHTHRWIWGPRQDTSHKHTHKHTLRWCVSGQVSAAQSRLDPSSHHMDWYWSQNTERWRDEVKDGGDERTEVEIHVGIEGWDGMEGKMDKDYFQ